MTITLDDKKIVYHYNTLLPSNMFRKFHGAKVPSVPIYQANKFISLNKIQLEIIDEPYDLHPDFRMYLEPLMDELRKEFVQPHSKDRYYNNALAKFLSFDPQEKGGTLKIARSYFFYEWLVHLNPDRKYYPTSPDTLRSRFEGAFIDELLNKKAHLEDSMFPNTLGVNGLIFTSDGYLLIQRRSSLVGLEQESYSVSFGGVLSWDFSKEDQKKMIAKAISENIEKELNLVIDVDDIYSATYIMGIDRSLKYFGKPDIYVFTPIQETLKNLQITRSKEIEDMTFQKIARDMNQLLYEPIKVRTRLSGIVETLPGRISLHLKVALDMLDKILLEVSPL